VTVYEKGIEDPSRYLTAHGLREQILYIVTTLGLPLRCHRLWDIDANTTAAAWIPS